MHDPRAEACTAGKPGFPATVRFKAAGVVPFVRDADGPDRAEVMPTAASYRFGPFTVDGSAYRLVRGDETIPVSPKIIDLLLFLAARPSALVSKDELFRALWPDVAVTDNALTQAVSELRQALGDNPASPTYIQTVARRGYRFISPIEPVGAAADARPVSAPVEAPVPPSVAVLDFENVSGDASLGWLASGIAETVTNDLRAATPRIIDRVRVTEALASGRDLASLRRTLGIDRAVVGSFQRSGDRLRITSRVIDAISGECLADAKADGPLDQVFDLQDRIVSQLTEALGAGRPGPAERRHYRETSSLDAYQAFTEGRVRLESLDASQVAGAIADFERAIALDPRYAAAHVGVGNARFWQYEMSRARNQPDGALLARAIDHVRKAIELERDLADAHATLAFLLVSAGRSGEALSSARRAAALEPGYWGNQFRLAHAAWGDERLQALGRVIELYPDFPFAHFEAAMVHIARGTLDRAESTLREGTIVQDRQGHLKQRYPARGLHWLLGLVRLARGDASEALLEFDREAAAGAGQLYGPEFVMNAHDGAGFAHLAMGDPAAAAGRFQMALTLFPDHARSLVGLGAALLADGERAAGEAALGRASDAIEALRRGGRGAEALLAESFHHAVRRHPAEAVESLHRLLDRAEVSFTGWTIPVEPLLASLAGTPAFHAVLVKLAARAA
jgi:DNA-binding winged helix-turn-helix (wHTH) protein/Tfp pilus assembly protein PilF